MAGLGLLIYGAMQLVGGVGRTVEDVQAKKESFHLDEKGNSVCFGRTGQQYINGEETYNRTITDQYGNSHFQLVGRNTGKIYNDTYDKKKVGLNEETKRNYDYAIEHKRLAYEDLSDPRFNTSVLKEISTGKIITCLYKRKNPKTCKMEYRKWYLTDSLYREYGKSAYNKTEKGDLGILITKEEYLGLGGGWIGNVSDLPSDGKVLNVLWDTKCF